MSLPVVILAGGLATRLRPMTEKIPKALVEVAGRPFLEHQIALLKRNAIAEVILCVGYLGEMIEERYGDGDAFGVRIRYSFDGPQLLGTGGAIKKASAFLPDAFFVLYGDSYLPVDYQAVAAAFHEAGKPALMTVFANSDAWDTSNVWFDQGSIRLYSKRREAAGNALYRLRSHDLHESRSLMSLRATFRLIWPTRLRIFPVRENWPDTK